MQTPFKINLLDTEKNPIGISLPLTESSVSFFGQTYTTADQYKTNILNLIMTVKGERRMVPSFGTDLKRRIFEQNTNLEEVIKNDIEFALEEWIPEVSVSEINVYKSNDNEHAFLIKLFYTLPYDSGNIQQLDAEVK